MAYESSNKKKRWPFSQLAYVCELQLSIQKSGGILKRMLATSTVRTGTALQVPPVAVAAHL